MLFACEYCYGMELLAAGVLSGGTLLSMGIFWIRHKLFRRHTEECCCHEDSCDC